MIKYGVTEASAFSLPIVVSFVYVGFMVLAFLAYRAVLGSALHDPHLNPIVVANQAAEARVWFAGLRRTSAVVSVLLVVWLWVWCRPRVRRLGGRAAWPYLGAALLLAATHLMILRGVAAAPAASLELIQIWPPV